MIHQQIHQHENSVRLQVDLRWMVRRDMPAVLAIENECFEYPWQDEDFIRCLRQRNCIGMVAEAKGQIVGFMVYELHKHRLHVLNFAVAPRFQRREVGTQLLDKLKGKLSRDRRDRILLEVGETNIDAQLFLRASGFRAVSILRDYYEDTSDDAYLFQFRHKQGDGHAEGEVSESGGVARR